MAESGGFEPPVELLVLQRFSKPPPSATRPTLQPCPRSSLPPSAGVNPDYRAVRRLRVFENASHATFFAGNRHSPRSPARHAAFRFLRHPLNPTAPPVCPLTLQVHSPLHLNSQEAGACAAPTAKCGCFRSLERPTSWSLAAPTVSRTSSATQATAEPCCSCSSSR